jgi:hypothetical protein
MISGYENALKAAGAKIFAFEAFGDWQGSWLAYVVYRGERGWVRGYFGSCDHCDAFEAEFGYDHDAENEKDYPKRLANFGRTYLDALETTEQVLAHYEESKDWDLESQDVIFWIRETEQTYRVMQ